MNILQFTRSYRQCEFLSNFSRVLVATVVACCDPISVSFRTADIRLERAEYVLILLHGIQNQLGARRRQKHVCDREKQTLGDQPVRLHPDPGPKKRCGGKIHASA